MYFVWRDIKARTSNKNHRRYDDYGGRGISMCDEWFHSYEAFKKWSIEHGYNEDAPKGMFTIDRIDVDGNYEPANCRYISMQEQAYNKRNNHFITYNGVTKTVTEWAKECDVSRSKLTYHIEKYGSEHVLSSYLKGEEEKEVNYS